MMSDSDDDKEPKEVIELSSDDEDENLGGPVWWGRGSAPTLADLAPESKKLYRTLQDVKDAIKFLSIKHSFPYSVKQSCSTRFEVGCDGGNEDNIQCTFHVKARPQERFNGMATIIKSNLIHSCGCLFNNKKKVRGLGAAMVSHQAGPFVGDCSKATPRDIANHVKRTVGTTILYRTAHRAKQLCLDQIAANEEKSFQYIAPYFDKIESTMPGSLAIMERDSEDRLLRTFVMLKPIMDSFKYGLPLLTVDACHLRNKFKGCLMAITMVDSLKQTQLLAWGTCQVENGDNWDWFLRIFKDNMDQKDIGYAPIEDEDGEQSERVITIFSDREKGIAKALNKHFPTSYHVFCYFHIEKNVKTMNGSLKEETRRLMVDACKALKQSTFDRIMSKIRDAAPKV
jgi:MULE transposase domain